MLVTVTLPKLAETADLALIIEWQCREGDFVREGQPLVSLETDKVNTEVPAPASGVVVRLLVAENQEVAVGMPLCQIQVTE